MTTQSNNVPAGVARPDYPFAGSENIYSLTWAATTGKTRLLASDLASGVTGEIVHVDGGYHAIGA